MALLTATAVGCGSEEPSRSQKPPTGAAQEAANDSPGGNDGNGPKDLIARGERVYNVNCIACHHRDPRQDGGLGPPVAGASRELLEARVLRAEYPPGYTPKQDTRLMVPLKHLEPEIEALTAFLATFESE